MREPSQRSANLQLHLGPRKNEGIAETRTSVDIRVASLAHDLRNHCVLHGRKILETPDSIHLATAIHYRAKEFHTFDNELIALSGDVGGHKLIVCKPETNSPQLDLKPPKKEG